MSEPSRPLVIVHLLAPARFGGLESVVRLLAAGQAEAGAAVVVASLVEPDAGAHPFLEGLEREGVPVRALVIPHRGYLRERAEVSALLRELGADVLHTHGYRPDVLDLPVARGLGVATVSTVHGFTRNGPRNRFYEWVQRRTLRQADAVIAVSRQLAGELAACGIPRSRVRTIPNAWRPAAAPLPRAAARRALELPADARVIGFVGRVGAEKGPDLLVAAMTDPRLKGVHACFVGTGSAEPSVRELALRGGVADRIHWKGAVADAANLMPAFDVLALPSRTEGTPMVAFEAIGAGVPVVAAAVGGVPDLLGAGPHLVAPEDPGALAGALALLLDRPDEAARAAAGSAARIDAGHGVEPWIRRHLDLYREVAGSGAAVRVAAGSAA